MNIPLTSLAIVLAVANTLHAQEPAAPLETLKLATRVVAVSAVVLDSNGIPMRGLSPKDFTLKQDGKPQEIRYFSQDSTLPLTLALMVDTSASQRMFIQEESMASEKFFRAMLTRTSGPNPDQAILIQFDSVVLQLQPMTAQLQTLENALGFLSMRHAQGPGGTLLYDAILLASARMLGPERGRRAMVILTDGEDHGSRATLEQAIAAAQRSDTAIYSVVYSEAQFHSGTTFRRPPQAGQPDGRVVLDELSKATGGRVFTVSRETPLPTIYAQIAEDMRLQYQLGFTPQAAPPGSYHKLELKTAAAHATVHARQGFYTPK